MSESKHFKYYAVRTAYTRRYDPPVSDDIINNPDADFDAVLMPFESTGIISARKFATEWLFDIDNDLRATLAKQAERIAELEDAWNSEYSERYGKRISELEQALGLYQDLNLQNNDTEAELYRMGKAALAAQDDTP